MLSTMRKTRIIEHCRSYHLMSRLYPPAVRLLAKRGAMRGAHRAFFLDDKEKTRAVELLRRVEEFYGVMVLAYAIMSNHFHIYIYVPEPEEIDDEKARRGYAFMYGSADHWDVIRDSHEKSMREAMSKILAAREAERAEREAKGAPAPGRRANPPPSKADPGLDAPRRFALELERGDPAVVERILALLSDGPMKPAALREAVGIKSRIHFNRYYLAPMLEKGLLV